jgi:hypothetical protein
LKKFKFGGTASGAASNPLVIDDDNDDDNESIATADEDRTLLLDEPEELPPTPPESAVLVVTPPKTDFVPGSLDFDTLPIMPVSHVQIFEFLMFSILRCSARFTGVLSSQMDILLLKTRPPLQSAC